MTGVYENTLTYRKILKLYVASLILIIVPMLIIVFLNVTKSTLTVFQPYLFVLMLFAFSKLLFVLFTYYDYLNSYIKVSSQESFFYFGKINQAKLYHKNDIDQIKIFAPKDKKLKDVSFAKFKIIFKNDEYIYLSTVIIPTTIFITSFSEIDFTIIDTAFPFV